MFYIIGNIYNIIFFLSNSNTDRFIYIDKFHINMLILIFIHITHKFTHFAGKLL